MSRVYSVMTGSGGSRPSSGVSALAAPTTGAAEEPREAADDRFVVEAEDTPFIEVGGPAGPVFHPAPAKTPEQKPTAEVRAKAESARAFPRIAPTPAAAGVTDPAAALLSVHFHDAAPRAAHPAAGGPDPGLVALHFPDHPVSGEYRTLRDEVARQLPEATSRVLTFTAAATEAGTTTVLLNLGVTLAREGWRVLVVDANFTRPGVAAKLAVRPSPGLAEVLGHHLPLPWALQPTPAPSLQALAAGAATEATNAALARDFPKLVAQLRQWFDWVLIDAGVWGVSPDRDATCPAADAVYLVTREADAERPEFTGLRAWVKELGGTLRGYVTTRV